MVAIKKQLAELSFFIHEVHSALLLILGEFSVDIVDVASLAFLTQHPLNHTVLSLIKYFKFSKSKVFFVKLSNMAVISREKETYKMIYVSVQKSTCIKGFLLPGRFFLLWPPAEKN